MDDEQRPLTKMELRDIREREKANERLKAREKAFEEYRSQFKHTQTHLFGDNDHWIPPRDPLMIFFGSEDGKAIDRVDENGRLFFGHRPVSAAHVEQYWEHLREMRLDDPEAFKRLCARYQHLEDAYFDKLKDRADRRRERREKWEAKRQHEARKIRLSSMKLREIEKTKIECARKFFDEISKYITADRVKYDVVTDYGSGCASRVLRLCSSRRGSTQGPKFWRS